MSRSAALLSARGLRLVTGASIDLTLPGGALHCVSGPSGSGKTRLLRALADLDPTPGNVFLGGRARDDFAAPDWRRQVMLTPAQPRWWLDCVADHCATDVTHWARMLNLTSDHLHAPVDNLSTGEQARGGLLRSLSCQPRVLLLDEPTGALDADSTAAVETLLCQWLSPARAIVWISHDRAQIQRIAHQHWRLDTTGLRAA